MTLVVRLVRNTGVKQCGLPVGFSVWVPRGIRSFHSSKADNGVCSCPLFYV